MWLSEALLLTIVLTLHGPPSTEEYNSLPTTQNHEQGAAKLLQLLNKYLLMLSFENRKNSSIQFRILNNGPIFNLIQNEKNTVRSALVIWCHWAVLTCWDIVCCQEVEHGDEWYETCIGTIAGSWRTPAVSCLIVVQHSAIWIFRHNLLVYSKVQYRKKRG